MVVLLRVRVLSHVHDAAVAVVEHVEVQYTAGSAQLLVFVLAERCSRILPNRLVPRYVFDRQHKGAKEVRHLNTTYVIFR